MVFMPRVRSAELPLTRMVQVFRTLPLAMPTMKKASASRMGRPVRLIRP